VSDRQNAEMIVGDQICKVVGESRDRCPPDLQVSPETVDGRT
jgi:hypothetical protein